ASPRTGGSFPAPVEIHELISLSRAGNRPVREPPSRPAPGLGHADAVGGHGRSESVARVPDTVAPVDICSHEVLTRCDRRKVGVRIALRRPTPCEKFDVVYQRIQACARLLPNANLVNLRDAIDELRPTVRETGIA